MDDKRFDHLVRTLAANVVQRRAALRGLAGSGLAAVFALAVRADNVESRKKKRKRKKDKDKGDGCRGGCSGGRLCCDGDCVSVLTDPRNCGECDNVCVPVGSSRCVNGECRPCDGLRVVCDGQCVDLTTDPSHCSACNRQCRAREECIGGNCVCPGETCPQNGACCPAGYHCVREGAGCCPNGFFSCNNGRCCPAGSTCGGSCGGDCCSS